jgi:hypothetical protein
MTKASKNESAGLVSIGVDIGKEVFHLVGFDSDGELVLLHNRPWVHRDEYVPGVR